MYITLYTHFIKMKYSYNFILVNNTLNLTYILYIKLNSIYKLHLNLYIKLLKHFFFENGFKFFILNNWYKYGIKFNLIYNLLFI